MAHKSRHPLTRRDALCQIGNGFGMLAFASLVGESLLRAAGPFDQDGALDPRKLDHPARAKRVIFLFMNGGLSQVDSFDPKPMLDKYHGQPLPGGSVATAPPGSGWPWYLSSIGFGSKLSTCERPPFMNRKITRLARAG